MAFEPVHTMTEWYDGPRRGIADVNRRPHLYESCWNDIDTDEDDMFLLSPISNEVFLLALEDWQICERWSIAHRNGEVTEETHPCLPHERERHWAVQQELKARLVLDENAVFAATAVFQYTPLNVDGTSQMSAEWTIVPYDKTKDKRSKYEWAVEDD